LPTSVKFQLSTIRLPSAFGPLSCTPVKSKTMGIVIAASESTLAVRPLAWTPFRSS
jgi:hypothetical protein